MEINVTDEQLRNFLNGMHIDNIIVDSIRAYGKHCIGCLYTQTDIMISYKPIGSVVIQNIFLTNEHAQWLILELQKRLKENQE